MTNHSRTLAALVSHFLSSLHFTISIVAHHQVSPPLCCRCDQYCPSNVLSTITDVIGAIWNDILTVVRLIAVCFGRFGLSGCVCQFGMTLQPQWRKLNTNPKVLCKNGDPFGMLVGKISELIKGWLADGVDAVIKVINDILSTVKIFGSNPIRWRLCNVRFFNLPCDEGLSGSQFAQALQCEDETRAGGLDMLCYYERVHRICTSGSMLTQYNDLFRTGYENISSVEREFASAFGDSYAYLDPTLSNLLEQLRTSATSGPDLQERQDVCSSSSFASAMSLDQIIVSCFFAMVEGWCPDDAEEDESFAFEIESTSFQLPKVRFDYDVSPPPPPPLALSAIYYLVEDDPEGWDRARSKLKDLFPTLSHVATSSVGASIGPYVADFDVTSHQMTRAFLASLNLEEDSLGARVVQSKHTGRWRFACMELFRFAKEHTSPGRRSAAYGTGSEQQAAEHSGQFDRNMLLYVMLEVYLSLSGSDRYGHDLNGKPLGYSTLDMYNFVCGSGNAAHVFDGTTTTTIPGPAGWRVAAPPQYSATWDTTSTKGVRLDDFGPIVAYGSLETLRSMRLATLHYCEDGFAPEDGAKHLACERGEQAVSFDLKDRATYSPFTMQRDRWCDPNVNMDIEDVVGNPFSFTSDLTDTTNARRRLFFKALGNLARKVTSTVDKIPVVSQLASLSPKYRAFKYAVKAHDILFNGGGSTNGAASLSNRQNALEQAEAKYAGADSRPDLTRRPNRAGIQNDLRVPASARGEENLVGSNGQYRHLSLMSWVYVTSSSDPNVRAGMYRLLDLPVFRNTQCSELPAVKCSVPTPSTPTPVVLHPERPLVDFAGDATTGAAFVTGKQGIVMHRCSQLVASTLQVDCLYPNPYSAHSECYQGTLELGSRPQLYGATHFLARLDPNVQSPSPPPPPPTPNPPPSPNTPSPSAPGPYHVSQRHVMAIVRDAEQRMCTSVYFLSQATRCSRLAQDLTQRVLINYIEPPSPPPPSLEPESALQTTPPPSPALPEALQIVPLRTASLSTLRAPKQFDGSTAYANTDGYYTLNQPSLRERLADIPRSLWACVPEAPLACASGILRCINDQRRCGEYDENARSPQLDAHFRLTAGHYLWAVQITLPSNEQLAQLATGLLRLELFGPRNRPVACDAYATASNAQITQEGVAKRILARCASGGATDAQLYSLSTAHRLVVTLEGDRRQIWFGNVQVLERPLRTAGAGAAPPPPPLQALQTVRNDTNTTPLLACDFYPYTFMPPRSLTVREEPCGLSVADCCAAARANEANAFNIDDAGCCELIVGALPEDVSAAANRTNDGQTWDCVTPQCGIGYVT